MPLYELLVRTVDKTSANPLKNAKLRKRGDVVVAKLAPAFWTEKERTSPEWQIITADIPEALAKSLTAPELPPDLSKKYKMLQRCGMRIDLDKLSGGARLQDCVSVKTRLREPDEISPPPSRPHHHH